MNQAANDYGELAPMVEHTRQNLGQMPTQWLADTGYCSNANLEHARDLEVEHGTEFFISTGRVKHSAPIPESPRGRIPANTTVVGRMGWKLKTKPGKKAYARRKAIVEPVFGQIHTRQGKYLLLRGLEKARLEWKLIAAGHNLMKLHSYRAEPAA